MKQGKDPTLAATTLEETRVRLKREGSSVENIGFESITGTLTMVTEGKIAKGSVPDVLREVAKGKSVDEAIQELQNINPTLYQEFSKALRNSNIVSAFFRYSGRFELSAKGDINFYPIFAEHNKTIINSRGRVGMVIASGIAIIL